jgi:translation initiation factor IF-2
VSKVRVYELSKQLGLPNKDIISLLADKFGVDVKNHASSVDADVVDKLTALLQKTAPASGATSAAGAKAPVDAKTPEEKSPVKKPATEKKTTVVSGEAAKPAGKTAPKPVALPPVNRFTEPTAPMRQTVKPKADAQKVEPVIPPKSLIQRPLQGQIKPLAGAPPVQRQGGGYVRPTPKPAAPAAPRPPKVQTPKSADAKGSGKAGGQKGDDKGLDKSDDPKSKAAIAAATTPRRDPRTGALIPPTTILEPRLSQRTSQPAQQTRSTSGLPHRDHRASIGANTQGGRSSGNGPGASSGYAGGQRSPGAGAGQQPGHSGGQHPYQRPSGGGGQPSRPHGGGPGGRGGAYGGGGQNRQPQVATMNKPVSRQDKRQPSRGEIRAQEAQDAADIAATPIDLNQDLTVTELAQLLHLRETDIIKHLFMKGVMVTVNQNLEVGFARTIAEELGYTVTELIDPDADSTVELADVLDKKTKLDISQFKHLSDRAPVISIMGHVDHGKTSLLDAIREAKRNIVDSEAGGITQRIGAYTVEKDGKRVVFLDTPGHEAFTTMRMRGAKSTDIAILVVAADDGVMPQTIEAINHAKAAEIPIIVAVNKVDKEGADVDRVLAGLSEHGLVSEKWGGETITVEVSALKQTGIDTLLEMILLVSELLELKADVTVPATGVIIEAKLDKRKGPVATALVQNGVLKVGDAILIGSVGGKVRALLDDHGERVNTAGPSTPVEILGLSDVPTAGEPFVVYRDDKRFKQDMAERRLQDKEARQSVNQPRTVGMVARGEDDQGPKFVHLVLKADTQGALEAVTNSLLQLDQGKVQLKILHAGTGDVSEADVTLASASGGIVVAFNVKEDANALRIAEQQTVTVLTFDVIYHLTEAIEQRMKGELAPETREVELGQAEVRQLFTVGKSVVIAGSMVLKGKMLRNAKAVVTRNNKVLFTGPLDNLKRFKDDAKEVAAGYECGISFSRFNELEIGDIVTVYTDELVTPA